MKMHDKRLADMQEEVTHDLLEVVRLAEGRGADVGGLAGILVGCACALIARDSGREHAALWLALVAARPAQRQSAVTH
jgi:hypothetical protein